jgi:hypothetical protein
VADEARSRREEESDARHADGEPQALLGQCGQSDITAHTRRRWISNAKRQHMEAPPTLVTHGAWPKIARQQK